MMKPSTNILLILLLIGLALARPGELFAQGTISPSPFQTVFNNSGTIVTNACVWTYTAGTSTPATTYTDSALSVANTNPIRSDSAARFTAYLSPGSAYKFVYETSCVPPAHGTTLRSADNIAATPSSSVGVDVLGTAGEAISANQCAYLSDGSGSKTSGQWFKCDSTNTYSSTLLTVGIATAAISSANTGTIRIAGSVTGFTSLSVGAAYFASTAGAVTTSAPANRRLLGFADTTNSIVLASNPPIVPALASGTGSNTTFLRGDQTWATPWTVITTTATGTVNDWAPATIVGNTEIRCNNASLLTVQGIAAGYDGQLLRLVSIGAGQVDLAHQNAGSTAANRLINVATSASTSLAAGSGIAEYQYDVTSARWRLVSHEQGAWITRTFAAGNYTASAGTWTVASASRDAYWLKGRTLLYSFTVSGTTSGTPVTVKIAIPGFTAAAADGTSYYVSLNGAAGSEGGYWTVAAAATLISLQRFANTAFAAGTVSLIGSAIFEVQ